MSGIVKRKFRSESARYMQTFTAQLNKISVVLPLEYDNKIVLDLYKEFYPNQWNDLVTRYEYYDEKDSHLISIGKRRRYLHKDPAKFFFDLNKVKQICSIGYREKHRADYSEEKRLQGICDLKSRTKMPKEIPENIQCIDPYYIEVFISAYHNKGSTLHEKIEVVNELKKFNHYKVIKFFQKLNDSERNNQIRDIAYSHLQSIGSFVRKRQNFKGKKKKYHLETNSFHVTPEDLAEKLEKKRIQSKKSYDIFISHSYKDHALVKQLKKVFNKHNMHIYCDWLSDDDFLRRDLVGKYTEVVLKERINQSKILLFLQTPNSIECNGNIASKWIELELKYASTINKSIFCINQSKVPSLFFEIFSGDSMDIATDEMAKLRESDL